MFKKITAVLVILGVMFLFCYPKTGIGIDSPILLEEKIFLHNYDKTLDTLYLMPSYEKDMYFFTFFNSSPNAYFYKIETNLTSILSTLGNEINKLMYSTLYPYSHGDIYLKINEKNIGVEKNLGYMKVKIFNLQLEKIQEIKVKKIIILEENKGPAKKGTEDIEGERGCITNLKSVPTTVLINISILRKNRFFLKVLSPHEKYFFNISVENSFSTEYMIACYTKNSYRYGVLFLDSKKYIKTKAKEIETKKEYESFSWCQSKDKEIYGFIAYENVLFLLCYSDISQKINIQSSVGNISRDVKLKQGWNNVVVEHTKSVLDEKIVLLIDNKKEYFVSKILTRVSSRLQESQTEFDICDNKLIYSTNVNYENKFIIVNREGIVYYERVSPERMVYPTYIKKIKKVIEIDYQNYKEVLIVSLNSNFQLITPTPDFNNRGFLFCFYKYIISKKYTQACSRLHNAKFNPEYPEFYSKVQYFYFLTNTSLGVKSHQSFS